jgi:hypothetical protein
LKTGGSLGAAGLLLDCAQTDIPAANRRKTIFTLRIALHVRQFNRRAALTPKIISVPEARINQ